LRIIDDTDPRRFNECLAVQPIDCVRRFNNGKDAQVKYLGLRVSFLGNDGLPSGIKAELDLACIAAATAPIAAKLRDHFANGGSIADGIKLVELLERAGIRASHRSQSGALKVVRGSRLAGDWHPSPPEIAFALDRGMPRVRIDTEIEKFRNYWIAKSGAGAVKRDWSATWRNWIITAMERGNGPSNYGARGPGTSTPTRRPTAGSDAVLAGMGRLAHRVDERRMSAVGRGQAIPDGADTASQFDFESRGTR